MSRGSLTTMMNMISAAGYGKEAIALFDEIKRLEEMNETLIKDMVKHGYNRATSTWRNDASQESK